MVTCRRLRGHSIGIIVLTAILAGCSGGDKQPATEPLLGEPEVGASGVPTSDFATETQAAGATAPANNDNLPPPNEPAVVDTAPVESETTGVASTDTAGMDGDMAAKSGGQSPNETPPTFEEGAIGTAPAGDDPSTYLPDDHGSGHHKKHKSKAPKRGKHTVRGGKGGAVRYVSVGTLNVRSKPSPKAKVVRKLKAGDEVHVVIKGQWARIGQGQWVKVKYLSSKAPRK